VRRRLRVIRLRLRSLFVRDAVEDELDEELRYHLERQIDEYVAGGMPPVEARIAALKAMGGVEQRKEECRDMRGLTLLDHLWQDAGYAARQLRAHLGFACTATVMLALGMCASVSIFAFVDASLVKPLPYRQPSRLAGVFERVALFPQSNLSYADYLDWKRQNTVFASLDVYNRTMFMLRGDAGSEPAPAARVSDGFFRTLGVRPALGRDFRAGEDLPSGPRVVMLSHATWQKRYGGKPDAMGRTVSLNGQPYLIIGVLPRDFHFAPAEPAEFWAALHPEGECDLRRSCHSLYGVGRLKDGVSFETASANLVAIAAGLEKIYPDSNRGQGATLVPLTDVISGDVRPLLLVLLGGAALLLVIAGVNVAGLLLVRSESRARELAVRTALGASRGRLLRQFLAESLVLASIGSVLGLAAASVAMRLLTTLIPADIFASMPYFHDLGLNARVLAFAATVATLAAVLFAVTPARHVLSTEPRAALTEGSRGSAGTLWRRLGSRLVVVELALAVVLLVGAGLLARSLYLVLRVDTGLRPDHLVVLQVAAPAQSYGKPEQALRLSRNVAGRVGGLPGVSSVGVTSMLPLSGWGNTTWFRVLGRPWHGEHNEVPEREVSATYFRTLGATLVRGRYFTDADGPAAPQVAIINRAMAREHFPDEDPIGKQISYLDPGPPKPITVVGIVEDIMEGPIDTTPRSVLYIPFDQSAGNYFSLVVRTTMAEQPLVGGMTSVIRRMDRDIVMNGGQSMGERIDRSPAAYLHRSSAWLVGGFAVLALLLGVVGLYGVVAYSVGQRTREIGVRMALGAERANVYRLVLGEAGGVIGLGIGIGLACALGATRLMRGLLFGVSAWDVPTLAAMATVLGASALLASFIPARRAASIDPADALRTE
jgi:macrolide transport system ATP-binding/permease protein